MKIFFGILAVAVVIGLCVFVIIDYCRERRKERSSRASDKAVSDLSINSEKPGNDK